MSTVVENDAKEKLAKVKAYALQSLTDLNVAGAAVAIVKDGDIIFSEGLGQRDVEQGLPVTADTLFPIGSSTKAFTTMSVGMLVDDGKLDWDTPVVSYLPEFKLHDKYASENATLRDLATHRVGLPRHEFVWYKSPLSREEIISRLKYLPLTKPFRTRFQYQNMMYLTLGYLVGKISGQSWESFVQSRILDALGMKRSNFSVDITLEADNYAKPYKVVNQEIRPTSFANIDAIGPAGSINSSINDMANWVKLHLQKGKYNESQIISEYNLMQMHSPHIPTGPSPDNRVLFPSYGLGWFTEVYRGHHVVYHGGNIDGFSATAAMIPRENLGVIILTNQEHSVFPQAATYTIFDTLLGLPTSDWNAEVKEYVAKMTAATKDSKSEGQDMDRVPHTTPSHELSAYAGEYEHPAYGTIVITANADELSMEYHSLGKKVPLHHVHYEVFSFSIGDEESPQQFKLQFQTDLRGAIRSLSVQFEPELAPFQFTRKASATGPNRDVLERYTGEFDLAEATVAITIRGNSTLTVTIPGQPTYELMPISDTEFEIKGLSGFEVQFLLDNHGACSQAKFKQPNGTFTLTRKSDPSATN